MGNLLNDGNHTYNWDVNWGNMSGIDTKSLTFDALGRMVEQASGSAYTQVLYGPGGGKLALMNGQTLKSAYIPLIGGAQAVYTASSTYYRHSDWLGSSRLAVLSSDRSVYFDGAYAPFGEAYDYSVGNDLSFTGQNQDTTTPPSQTGLYDFLFREQSPVQGRWVSPDPAGISAVDISNPQTWNRYAYLSNNPLNAIDPYGLYIVDCMWDGCPWQGVAGGGGGAIGGGGYGVDTGFNTGINMVAPGNTGQDGEVPQWYLDEVNQGQANLAHPGAPPVEASPADTTIWVYCGGTVSGGTLTSVGCAPPSQAVAGSVGYSNYGLSLGLDIWHCAGCGATWRNASGAANTAAVATGAVVVGAPALGTVFGSTTLGDALFGEAVFNPATNSAESGLLNTWKGLRYGWGYLQYGVVPTVTGNAAGMYVLRISSGAPSWFWWWHSSPF